MLNRFFKKSNDQLTPLLANTSNPLREKKKKRKKVIVKGQDKFAILGPHVLQKILQYCSDKDGTKFQIALANSGKLLLHDHAYKQTLHYLVKLQDASATLFTILESSIAAEPQHLQDKSDCRTSIKQTLFQSAVILCSLGAIAASFYMFIIGTELRKEYNREVQPYHDPIVFLYILMKHCTQVFIFINNTCYIKPETSRGSLHPCSSDENSFYKCDIRNSSYTNHNLFMRIYNCPSTLTDNFAEIMNNYTGICDEMNKISDRSIGPIFGGIAILIVALVSIGLTLAFGRLSYFKNVLGLNRDDILSKPFSDLAPLPRTEENAAQHKIIRYYKTNSITVGGMFDQVRNLRDTDFTLLLKEFKEDSHEEHKEHKIQVHRK